ncbi:MAG: hypothetical protein HFG29_08780 [Eubacterium sp.]|nr:hypothetical protein [Eubacterium sp.]
MKNNNKEEMPLGLGFGLAMNDNAMEHFSNLTDSEKKQVIETARTVQSKKEMNSLIQDIAKM